jgi:hypothetical protein
VLERWELLGAVGEEGGEGKHTKDDGVGGEDGEVWVQFLYDVRAVSMVDLMEVTYV